MASYQIPLNIKPDSSFSFENFYTDAQNQVQLAEILTLTKNPEIVILQGAVASGKTHILQAFCNELNSGESMYIPGQKIVEHSPEMLRLENAIKYICVDDVDVLLDKPDWAIAIFDIYNQVYDENFCLIMSMAGREVEFALPDLESRFANTRTIKLNSLDDVGKKSAFLLKAKSLGLKIDDKVVDFINRHYSRNLHELMQLLARLDEYSMSHKNKITVPMVRKFLAS